MSRHVVTWGDYLSSAAAKHQVLGNTDFSFPDELLDFDGYSKDDLQMLKAQVVDCAADPLNHPLRNIPVTNVSWYEAHAYALDHRMRLPLVWEWQKAARGSADARSSHSHSQPNACSCNAVKLVEPITCYIVLRHEAKHNDCSTRFSHAVQDAQLLQLSFRLQPSTHYAAATSTTPPTTLAELSQSDHAEVSLGVMMKTQPTSTVVLNMSTSVVPKISCS